MKELDFVSIVSDSSQEIGNFRLTGIVRKPSESDVKLLVRVLEAVRTLALDKGAPFLAGSGVTKVIVGVFISDDLMLRVQEFGSDELVAVISQSVDQSGDTLVFFSCEVVGLGFFEFQVGYVVSNGVEVAHKLITFAEFFNNVEVAEEMASKFDALLLAIIGKDFSQKFITIGNKAEGTVLGHEVLIAGIIKLLDSVFEGDCTVEYLLLES